MTPSSAAPAANPGKDGRPPRWTSFIPWIFVAGFAVVVAVNGVLIYFASSSFTGLETEHAYERGLTYNDSLEAAAAQERLGWRAEIALFETTSAERELSVSFADKLDRPIDGLAVEAFLLRPANAGMDMHIALAGKGNGRYATDVALPALGQWEIRIVARDHEHSWQKSERLFVK